MKNNTDNINDADSHGDSGDDEELDDDDEDEVVGDEDEEALDTDDEIDPSVQVSESTTVRSYC